MLGLTSTGDHIFVIEVVCCLISIVAIVLRIWCKFAMRKGMGWDDRVMLTAETTYLASASVILWGMFDGSHGHDIEELMVEVEEGRIPVENMTRYLKSLAIAVALFFFTTYTVKISVCLFFRQLFDTHKYRVASTTLIVASTLSFIATELSFLFLCQPMNHFWEPENQGECGNLNIYYLIVGLVDTMLDLLVLVAPIWAVFQIQIPMRTKLILSGVFLLGSFVIITDILRIAYQYHPGASTINFFYAIIWANVHNTTAVICACLPVYQPVRSKLASGLNRLRNMSQPVVKPVSRFLHPMHRGGARSDSVEVINSKDNSIPMGMVKQKSSKPYQTGSIDSSQSEVVDDLLQGRGGAMNFARVTHGQSPREQLSRGGITITREFEVV